MTVEVLFFASYRERVGQSRVELTLPAGSSVREAAAALEAEYSELELKGSLAAIDETYAAPDKTLNEGVTLAFFPPVAGGSGRDADASDHFFVTDAELELGRYVELATHARYGAVATFSGTVRSPNAGQQVEHIDYQGYEAMILVQMKRAASELRDRFELGHIVFAHRLGQLEPGEASIVIVTSSAHRKDALLAIHAAIDRLKEILPVWKLEVTTDGGRWVEGSAAASETL